VFDRAERFGGLRFMSVSDTLYWKQHLRRRKDLADLDRFRQAA
jgi:hypothetical protein